MIKIPKIEIKAMKAKEVSLEKLKFPLIAQLKYDGIRLITKINNDVPKFYTYNGNEVPLPKLKKQILKAKLGSVMLDGEIIIQGGRVGTRPQVSGMINSALHGGSINESILSYAIFDSMNIHAFDIQQCNDNYQQRYHNASIYAYDAKLLITRNTTVNTIEDVQYLSEQLYRDGFEGLILKPKHHLYKFSRSSDWIKIKETKTADLLCTGTTPGTGKYISMIGALICSGIVEDRYVIVRAGSGMTDKQRAVNPCSYINKIIELKYNSIIQDKQTSEWSLFLPRFNCIRIDK